ncbi:hypothetical protein SLS62_008418 [Diatrype stigma]|uniref:Charged multivesicular body protein 7 n=1 Tax=Diatrype stigma TaxID=117547 RepID=A0AAN9ULD1_9PEZI
MSELLEYLVENEPSFRRARLPALYSDFRSQRTLNPDGYAANISAWKRGLGSAALAGRAPSQSAPRNHFTLELDDHGAALLAALESKQFGRPLALGTVFRDAIASGDLMPLQTFLAARESIYYKSWGSVPWSVVAWGLRQAGLDRGVTGLLGIDGSWGGEDRIPKGRFVVLQNLEAAAKAFSDAVADRASLSSPFERTFSKAHFRRTFEGSFLPSPAAAADKERQQRLSETDLDVLVRFLSRDKGILATDGHTIKIRTSTADDNATITEEDSAIASLKELAEDLTRQTEALTRRVDDLQVAAQDAVRRKNRVAGLAALKSRKIAEAALAQRHATLRQLDEVAARLQQAADNVQMVRTMQASTAALRGLNAAVGGAGRVDEVLDALREQMAEVDEVGGLIADVGQGTAAGAAVDEVELDDELEAMLAEERGKEEAARRAETEASGAEEARRALAELERLGPVPVGLPGEDKKEKEKEKRPPTPATAAAEELGGLSIA